MGDIRALTLIGHATRRPIRHTLTQEKLANNIKTRYTTVKHSPSSQTNRARTRQAQGTNANAHAPNKGRARDTGKHTIAEPATHVNKRPAAAKGKGRARPHAR